jgi:undecaprenyl-diphosphatase
MKNKFITSAVWTVAFAVLIVMLCTYNVVPIGPEGTEIGFSSLNGAVHEALGVSETWYEISEIFGYLAIATAGAFALLGFVQAVKRKSLLKVDKKLIALGGLYAAMAFMYVLFEIVVINYRPIIEAGAQSVEASFPSSHTMLVCVIMGGAFVILKEYVKNKGMRVALQIASLVIAVLTAASRLLSGVHWFTDIIGGVLISLALVTFYSAVCELIESKKE